MIELKTADEIDKMAVTGEFVAETLAVLSNEAQPGVNAMELEHHARALISERGAKQRDQDNREWQERDAENNVGEAHKDHIDAPSEEAGDKPDIRADRGDEKRRDDADDHRHACSVDQLA